MRCKNCGAELPANADYCFECGAQVNDSAAKSKNSNEVVIHLDKRALYCIAIGIALLLLASLYSIFINANKSNAVDSNSQSRIEEEETIASEEETRPEMEPLSEDAVIMQGFFEVGVDKDLPPGKYEIRTLDNTYTLWVDITVDGETIDFLHGTCSLRNYVLKEGYVIECGETAFIKMD